MSHKNNPVMKKLRRQVREKQKGANYKKVPNAKRQWMIQDARYRKIREQALGNLLGLGQLALGVSNRKNIIPENALEIMEVEDS